MNTADITVAVIIVLCGIIALRLGLVALNSPLLGAAQHLPRAPKIDLRPALSIPLR